MISLFLSVCLSVCAPFRPYNSNTITPIKLKFGGQVFLLFQCVYVLLCFMAFLTGSL